MLKMDHSAFDSFFPIVASRFLPAPRACVCFLFISRLDRAHPPLCRRPHPLRTLNSLGKLRGARPQTCPDGVGRKSADRLAQKF
jgi:hypothetical protein